MAVVATNPNDKTYPGLIGLSQRMFNITPSDTDDEVRGFRFLKAKTAGTMVFVNWDSTTCTDTVVVGEYIMCGGRRVNSTGTTATFIGYE